MYDEYQLTFSDGSKETVFAFDGDPLKLALTIEKEKGVHLIDIERVKNTYD